MSDKVTIDRTVLDNLLAGWDEGLWGPETQDAGVPDTILGIVDSLRAAALAPAPAAASSGAEAGVLDALAADYAAKYAHLTQVTASYEEARAKCYELKEGKYEVVVGSREDHDLKYRWMVSKEWAEKDVRLARTALCDAALSLPAFPASAGAGLRAALEALLAASWDGRTSYWDAPGTAACEAAQAALASAQAQAGGEG